MKLPALIVAASLFSCAVAGAAPLKVVTSLPDLAEIVKRIGGDQVEAEALLSGREDAHFADAVPSFISKVASADIVCVVGLDLEVGWMPKVLSKSGNGKVQSGGKGHCDIGSGVSVLEKPAGSVDRSMGDVHPGGNPHFNLSPKALTEAAVVVTKILSSNRPESSAHFEKGLAKFKSDMEAIQKSVRERLKPLIDSSKERPVVIEYHKHFSYFFDAYGLKSLGSIEEKPGVPPSAARLAEVATDAKSKGVKVAVAANFSPSKQMARFTELSGIKHKQLPTAVQPKGEANTIEKLQLTIADALAE